MIRRVCGKGGFVEDEFEIVTANDQSHSVLAQATVCLRFTSTSLMI